MITRILRLPILLWHRLVSPALPPCCRFYPSCAQYALDALDRHAWPRALWLIVWRVACCNPFHPGGFDPVPEPRASVGPADAAEPVAPGNAGPEAPRS